MIELAIEAALTDDQRARFLDVFSQLNPHYEGCHVADALEALSDGDAHLDILEPAFETHREDIATELLPWYAMALLALVYADHEPGSDWPHIPEHDDATELAIRARTASLRVREETEAS